MLGLGFIEPGEGAGETKLLKLDQLEEVVSHLKLVSEPLPVESSRPS